jgi:TM2 domain-containing membrane protein YozV
MTDQEYPSPVATTSLPPVRTTQATMPHPLDAEWHVGVDDKIYGPFTGTELKSMAADGRLEYDSLVQKVGGSDKWIKASEDRALSKFFMPAAKTQPAKQASITAGDGAQVVTVNNIIGVQPSYYGERPVDKTAWVAAILSLLFVGIGQMYNGEVGKGFLMMLGCILLWTVMLGWIVNIWSIIDAYSVANRKHEAYESWMQANSAAARAQAA